MSPSHTVCLLAGALSLASAGALGGGSVGLVVHGFHCQGDRFEEVVWGEGQQLGRLPHAALLAWRARSDLAAVVCGTGASYAVDGVTFEADALVSLLFERLPRLREFEAFEGVDLAELEGLLRRTVVADTSSVNTEQEVRHALRRLQGDGVRNAVLVSSPTHVPRCLRDACAACDDGVFDGIVWASPCGTSWTSEPPVVLEPPHRGDRDRSLDADSFYATVRRAYAIRGAERREKFLQELRELVAAYEHSGVLHV